MTGIEVFANLVAAYEGTPAQKSKKAFTSLLLIMGTTALTMLIVGPAIFALSNPTDAHISVFTQTMDQLLPDPLPYLGSLVGVAVLISASAASAQGLQNLALGLYERHYIPSYMGERNEFDVADKPVWLQVGIVGLCFAFFGTHEETYLAIYAAGVFILLSMTAWAVTKRLWRRFKTDYASKRLFLVFGTITAALLTTGATAIIFYERFLEGAWTFFIFVPLLYGMFTYFRKQMGNPSPEMEYLGMLDAAQLAGFGFGQYPVLDTKLEKGEEPPDVTWQPEPKEFSTWREDRVSIKHIVVPLDGSTNAARALPVAKMVCRAMKATLHLVSSVRNHTPQLMEQYEEKAHGQTVYLQKLSEILESEGYKTCYAVRPGFIADVTSNYVEENEIDLVILSTHGKSGDKNWEKGEVTRKLVQRLWKPVLMVQAIPDELHLLPRLKHILVALDGSLYAERTLPYARAFSKAFGSDIYLLSVPAVPSARDYRAPAEYLERLRANKDANMRKFLHAVAGSLRKEDLHAFPIVTGSLPAKTIVEESKAKHIDMIMVTSSGRGGLKLLLMGSVASRVVEGADSMVFIMPIPDENGTQSA